MTINIMITESITNYTFCVTHFAESFFNGGGFLLLKFIISLYK